MTLAPLADVDDVILRLGRTVTTDDEARLTALIDDASAAIRLYTGRTFGTSTHTVRLPIRGGKVTLPDDISEITTVQTIAGTDVAYDWDGGRNLWVGVPWQFDIEPLRTTNRLDITYVRVDPIDEVGLAVLLGIVCQVVGRAFGRPADDSGVQQESIAGYSYTVGAAAAAGPIGLLADERRALDRFRRVGNTAWLAVR